MPALETLRTIYQKRGVTGIARFVFQRYLTDTPYDYRVISRFPLYKHLLNGKDGIEIGGPSGIFTVEIPIYKHVGSLDGCNFSTSTIWEGTLEDGDPYNYFDGKKGRQFIREASDLTEIEEEKYDFLLASHVLEHCANPLKAMKEWLRVLKPGGIILLVLPDKRFTFDRQRMVTSFEHLLEDYNRDLGEDDLTHLSEILEFHDLAMDNEISNINLTSADFHTRSLDNGNNRALHQHVFDLNLLEKIFGFFVIRPIHKAIEDPFHQIILGQKI